MNNNSIADLTVQLQKALDKNYDVVDMATVLFVISQLEGATITKEQLETTRLGKYINQLRRRTWSDQLARRSKNLLKRWREMFMPTIQQQQLQHDQSSQQLQPQHTVQLTNLQAHSLPTSPVMPHIQNQSKFFSNSSSIPENLLITGKNSVNRKHQQQQQQNILPNGIGSHPYHREPQSQSQQYLGNTGGGGGGGVSLSKLTKSSSNHAQSQQYNRRQPTSFANLIGSQSSQTSTGGPYLENVTGNPNIPSYIIDDNRSQSPIMLVPQRISRTGCDRQSPLLVQMDHSVSPLEFENASNPSRENSMIPPSAASLAAMHGGAGGSGGGLVNNLNNSNNQTRVNGDSLIATPIFDLHDSNSNNVLNVSTRPTKSGAMFNSDKNLLKKFNSCIDTSSDCIVGSSSDHRKNKKHKKDKKRHKINDKTNDNVMQQQIQSSSISSNLQSASSLLLPSAVSDETQICNSSIFQSHDSMSNSSMSLFPFPSTHTKLMNNSTHIGNTINKNNNNINSNSNLHQTVDSDLTFAGKFNKNVPSNSLSTKTIHSAIESRSGFPDIGCSKSSRHQQQQQQKTQSQQQSDNFVVVVESRSCSPFTPIAGNSNESCTSSSHTSNLVPVINNDIVYNDNDIYNNDHHHHHHHPEIPPIVYNDHPPILQQHVLEDLETCPVGGDGGGGVVGIKTLQDNPEQLNLPKKRGRKKGSKGVDAMLAKSNTFLNSQLLDNSRLSMASLAAGSKKVKTTKELLADIQNRKLGSATSSPTLPLSRPPLSPSTCSEISMNSEMGSTGGASSVLTSATNVLSTKIVEHRKTSPNTRLLGKKLKSLWNDDERNSASDSNLTTPIQNSIIQQNFDDDDTKRSSSKFDNLQLTTSIEDYINELHNQLPPIDKQQIQLIDNTDIICTCTIRETDPITNNSNSCENEGTTDIKVKIEIDPKTELYDNSSNNSNNNNLQIKTERPVCNDDLENTTSKSLLPPLKEYQEQEQQQQQQQQQQKQPQNQSSIITSPKKVQQKPIKSIFDLDYDEDDDPLHSFIEAAKLGPTNTINDDKAISSVDNKKLDDKSEINIIVPIIDETHQQQTTTGWNGNTNTMITTDDTNQQNPDAMLINFPQYEAIVDPNCPAKYRYETQTNCITKYHINALHNRFISNVNGNWDDSIQQQKEDTNGNDNTINIDDDQQLVVDHDLYERVVPEYSHILLDRIPKDLSHVQFTKNYKIKKPKIEQQHMRKRKRRRSSSKISSKNLLNDKVCGDKKDDDGIKNNIHNTHKHQKRKLSKRKKYNNDDNKTNDTTTTTNKNNSNEEEGIVEDNIVCDISNNIENRNCKIDGNLLLIKNNINNCTENSNNNNNNNNIINLSNTDSKSLQIVKPNNNEDDEKMKISVENQNNSNLTTKNMLNINNNNNNNNNSKNSNALCNANISSEKTKTELVNESERTATIINDDKIIIPEENTTSNIIINTNNNNNNNNINITSPRNSSSCSNNNHIDNIFRNNNNNNNANDDNNQSFFNNDNNDTTINNPDDDGDCFDDDDDDEEEEEEEDYEQDDDYDDIVDNNNGLHDMISSTSTTSQKHIVLTIKKTPNKTPPMSSSSASSSLLSNNEMNLLNNNDDILIDGNSSIKIKNPNENKNTIMAVSSSDNINNNNNNIINNNNNDIIINVKNEEEENKQFESENSPNNKNLKTNEQLVAIDKYNIDQVKTELNQLNPLPSLLLSSSKSPSSSSSSSSSSTSSSSETDTESEEDLSSEETKTMSDDKISLPDDNNYLLESFNNLTDENQTGLRTSSDGNLQQFKEWHELLQARSYNDELLTILPYVVID